MFSLNCRMASRGIGGKTRTTFARATSSAIAATTAYSAVTINAASHGGTMSEDEARRRDDGVPDLARHLDLRERDVLGGELENLRGETAKKSRERHDAAERPPAIVVTFKTRAAANPASAANAAAIAGCARPYVWMSWKSMSPSVLRR